MFTLFISQFSPAPNEVQQIIILCFGNDHTYLWPSCLDVKVAGLYFTARMGPSSLHSCATSKHASGTHSHKSVTGTFFFFLNRISAVLKVFIFAMQSTLKMRFGTVGLFAAVPTVTTASSSCDWLMVSSCVTCVTPPHQQTPSIVAHSTNSSARILFRMISHRATVSWL